MWGSRSELRRSRPRLLFSDRRESARRLLAYLLSRGRSRAELQEFLPALHVKNSRFLNAQDVASILDPLPETEKPNAGSNDSQVSSKLSTVSESSAAILSTRKADPLRPQEVLIDSKLSRRRHRPF